MSNQLASDNFQRANENPLSDGGNWTSPGFTSGTKLALVSDAVTTTGGNAGSALWTGASPASWPNDQYSQITLGTTPRSVSGFTAVVRSSVQGDDNGYEAYLSGTGTGVGSLGIYKDGFSIHTVTGLSFSAGDTIGISAVGTTLTLFHNGAIVWSLTDATIHSGIPGFTLQPENSDTVAGWSGGSGTITNGNAPWLQRNRQFANKRGR
jgi:hypothetical protein